MTEQCVCGAWRVRQLCNAVTDQRICVQRQTVARIDTRSADLYIELGAGGQFAEPGSWEGLESLLEPAGWRSKFVYWTGARKALHKPSVTGGRWSKTRRRTVCLDRRLGQTDEDCAPGPGCPNAPNLLVGASPRVKHPIPDK